SQTLLPAETPFSGIANEISKEGWAQTIVNHTGAFGKAITSILNSLAESLNSFLADMFDQAFADSIIKAGGQGQLPQLGPALQIIMYVYLVYQILKILGHLIFKCEEDELKLGIERKVGNCHYVGSYCAKDTFLGCVQTNESYCCFSSPLARIIHEQARAQGVGADPFMRRKGYGKPKHPRCKGLTLTEMSQIDWNAIDLTEWISLLQDAGIHPSTANPSDMVGIGP
ncbi:conjugal transfer protein TraN, partial [Thiolapillus sp.]